MATDKICAIEGCGKPARRREWCRNHYHRRRMHGDPLAGGIPRGERERYFYEVVLPFEGDECLRWPYSKAGKGYGTIGSRQNTELVHRRVCEEVNGPPPSEDHEAAHSCGNGHLACVNKRHLSWKTRTENERDKLIHGTHNRGSRHGMSKIVESDVHKIRSMAKSMYHREIADIFGLSRRHVGDIINRVVWNHI